MAVLIQKIASAADRIETIIDARAHQALAEIRALCEDALRAVDRILGIHPHFTARSLGQRRRYRRAKETS